MNNEKRCATIHDFAKMCKFYDNCDLCPLGSMNCNRYITQYTDKASEIIVDWCKLHSDKTRQGKFLKLFPNAELATTGAIALCPKAVDTTFQCPSLDCSRCYEEYWLAESCDEEDKRCPKNQ